MSGVRRLSWQIGRVNFIAQLLSKQGAARRRFDTLTLGLCHFNLSSSSSRLSFFLSFCLSSVYLYIYLSIYLYFILSALSAVHLDDEQRVNGNINGIATDDIATLDGVEWQNGILNSEFRKKSK